MDTLLNVNLSQQSALQRRMDVLANNMANLNTTGYKGEQVLFQNYLDRIDAEGPRGLDEINYLLDFGTIRSLQDGPVQSTQNPLDLALQGDGFLTVEGADGEPLYARRGNLTIDTAGFLALRNSGERVLDDNGQAIGIDPLDGTLEVSQDGQISGERGVIAQLGLARFENERALLRQGNGLFRAVDAEPQPVEDLRIVQGALEGSNVNAIKQTTEMIQVMRAYQSAQRASDQVNDLRERAIDRLGRVQ